MQDKNKKKVNLQKSMNRRKILKIEYFFKKNSLAGK